MGAVTSDAILTAVRTAALALTPETYAAVALAIARLVARRRVTETQRRACRQRLAAVVREAGPTAAILRAHAGIDVLVAAALLGGQRCGPAIAGPRRAPQGGAQAVARDSYSSNRSGGNSSAALSEVVRTT